MAVDKRKELIKQLEDNLNTRLLSVVLGDRQQLETKLASDILPLVSDLLTRIDTTESLSIFLYTRGGDSIAGWSLVNLARQYSNNLKVLVASRALSAGTLIALGANEIVMGKHGQLSPIDPSVASPFNPPAPGQPAPVTLLPVSVEDMAGFLDLARKEVGLKADESMVEVLKILSDKIHPLALGAVYRAREQNRELARRLLNFHMKDESRVNHIVDKLTRELPTHSYLIGLNESRDDIKLHVKEPDAQVGKLMWDLYKEYERWLQLTTPHSSERDLGKEAQKEVRYERAVVECLDQGELAQHIYVTDKMIFKAKASGPGIQGPIDQVLERIIFQGWLSATDGEVLS